MPILIDNSRCIICDYSKSPPELKSMPEPLCHWCGGSKVIEMIYALNEEMMDEVNSENLIDCSKNDLFRFLSDLGELAASHPYLQAVRDIISTLIMKVHAQNRTDYFTLRGSVPSKSRKRLITILSYLHELGLTQLITEHSPSGFIIIKEVTIPSGSVIQKALITMEASGTWEERKEPNLVLSYIIVRGLAETIKLIERKGFLNVGEGITRLYIINERVQIPKQFTAPLAFILGSWANGQDEFTEDKIISFLSLRKLTHSQRVRIMQIVAGDYVGIQHTIYRLEKFPYGQDTVSYRFILNPRFIALRDRLRFRMR